MPASQVADSTAVVDPVDRNLQQVGFADKVRNEHVARTFIDILGFAQLLQFTRRHDCDPVRHGQRFFLIVGHEDKSNPRLALKVFELQLHRFAKLEIKR